MRITNRTFSGERPKALAWGLQDNEAQLAIDCELHSGGIIAMLANRFETKFDIEPRTVYFYDGEWLAWDKRVHVIESPTGVSNKRLFWTDDGYPKQSTAAEYANGKFYRMGVPSPAAPQLVEVSGSALEASTAITTLYVASFVNKWGEEGDMSLPSELIDFELGQTIRVDNLGNVPDNAASLDQYDSISSVRLYRLDADQSRFVTELQLSQNEYADVTGTTVLGDTFATADYIPPPDDMQGLHVMTNDIALGFVGKTVHVSEVGQFNAWPHSFNVRSEVVGIASFDNTAVILTKGFPEVATIYDPSSISPSMLAEREPCVSQWSIVQAVQGVMYAAPSGLFFIGASGGAMLTEEYMDDQDWQALNPETMHSAYRDGEYYAWYEGGDDDGRCMVFDTRESNAVLRRLSASYQAVHVKEGSDEMYVCDGKILELFQGGEERIPYRWVSKEFGTGTPVAFTTARLISAEYGKNGYAEAQKQSVIAYDDAIADSLIAMNARQMLSEAYGFGGAINQDTFAGADFLPIPGAPAYLGAQDTGVAVANGANVPVRKALAELTSSVMVMADSETMDVTDIVDEEPYRLQYWDRARHWEYEIYGTQSVAQFDMSGSASEMHDGS